MQRICVVGIELQLFKVKFFCLIELSCLMVAQSLFYELSAQRSDGFRSLVCCPSLFSVHANNPRGAMRAPKLLHGPAQPSMEAGRAICIRLKCDIGWAIVGAS